MTTTGPDQEAVERRITSLNRMMYAHRGGVDLHAVHEDGTIVVQYRGMCTGCAYRPICSETAVRPALVELAGVSSVDVRGSRVNEENRRALVDGLTSWEEPDTAERG